MEIVGYIILVPIIIAYIYWFGNWLLIPFKLRKMQETMMEIHRTLKSIDRKIYENMK